jgi:ATP-dependent Clp protease ATP-binding subunit ClpA
LFAGILRSEGSVGYQILADMAVDRVFVEEEVRLLHPVQPAENDRLPFSAALREALLYAVAESQWLDHHYVGTEHILLGLVRGGRGEVMALWQSLELSPDQIRGRAKRLLQEGISEITLEMARRMAKLSELGRRVLNAAEQVAHSYQQHSVGPAHLLYVLTRERRSITCRLLPDCDFDVDRFAELVPALPPKSVEAEAMLDHLIDRAVDRAEALGSHYTGTEHILLAMTLEPRARDLLTDYGADVDCLQDRLREALLK